MSISKKTTDVGIILIDYFQLLKLEIYKGGSRNEELKQICLGLKDCAIETGIPILLAAQFNREVVRKELIHATNIAEAADIERIANLIIGGWNNNYSELNQKGNIIEKKSSEGLYIKRIKYRDGEIKEATLKFNGNTGKISNYPSSDTESSNNTHDYNRNKFRNHNQNSKIIATRTHAVATCKDDV